MAGHHFSQPSDGNSSISDVEIHMASTASTSGLKPAMSYSKLVYGHTKLLLNRPNK